MLNQTTECAIKVLIYLSLMDMEHPVSPKRLAEELKESPSYMAKVTGLLVKAGILRAHRGVGGGVTLVRMSKDITLFEIVEACQGKILGDYCQDSASLHEVCSFHKAMHEIHQATTLIMKKWTLSALTDTSDRYGLISIGSTCKMKSVCPKEIVK